MTISQIVFGPILEAKCFRQAAFPVYIFCSPCSYPFHQTARILAAQLCCTFVPCPRHLSFGVVQLFLQFFPLSIIFLALFCFISSREFFHFENMRVYSASTLLKQNIIFRPQCILVYGSDRPVAAIIDIGGSDRPVVFLNSIYFSEKNSYGSDRP